MTNETPIPGTAPAMPEATALSLRAYLEMQQTRASQLTGVLGALETLCGGASGRDIPAPARDALVSVALSMACDLSDALDSVNLPEEAS